MMHNADLLHIPGFPLVAENLHDTVSDYTAKIKSICDSLGSININIDDDEMVQICLGGLAPRFGAMRTAVLAREKSPIDAIGRRKPRAYKEQ